MNMKSKKTHIFLMIAMVSVIVGLVCSSTLAIHIPAGGSNPGGDKIISGGSSGGGGNSQPPNNNSGGGGGSKPSTPPQNNDTETETEPEPEPEPEPHYCIRGIWLESSNGMHRRLICTDYNCPYGNHRYEEHAADWKNYNISTDNNGKETKHIQKCKHCNIRISHTPNYDEYGNQHICIYPKCTASHSPDWGEYIAIKESEIGFPDGKYHERICKKCGIHGNKEKHIPEKGTYIWRDADYHEVECKYCKTKYREMHNYDATKPKATDDVNHKELFKHWITCTSCDPKQEHEVLDKEHIDENMDGFCDECNIRLWKVISSTNEKEIEKVTDEEKCGEIIAKRQEKIKIVQVKNDESKNGEIKQTLQYIKEINRIEDNQIVETIIANGQDEFVIEKNGKYSFNLVNGGIAEFYIGNISRDLFIESILSKENGKDYINLRPIKSELRFNKKVCIKPYENNNKPTIDDNDFTGLKDLRTLKNTPEELIMKFGPILQNGVYKFYAKDTAGNEANIEVEIKDIKSGDATVAISYDTFINGYISTEILVNVKDEVDSLPVIESTVFKVGDTNSGKNLQGNNIFIGNVMDMQRDKVDISNLKSGAYYIEVSIGGDIFNTQGIYVIDLVNTKFNIKNLDGKNRIIVNVNNLQDIT